MCNLEPILALVDVAFEALSTLVRYFSLDLSL